MIVGPFGKALAGPSREGERILAADRDVAGHYARPHVFRLDVNERQNT